MHSVARHMQKGRARLLAYHKHLYYKLGYLCWRVQLSASIHRYYVLY
jgi:hypothetical protein